MLNNIENVKNFMNNLIEGVIESDNESEINRLQNDNDDIALLLRTLKPSTELEMLSFKTLTDVQIDNLKRIASLYELNLNTKSIEA